MAANLEGGPPEKGIEFTGGNATNFLKRFDTLDSDVLYRAHFVIDRARRIVFFTYEEVAKAEGLNAYTQQLSG